MSVRVTRKARRGDSPYHHGDLRKALIDAALDLIGEHGAKSFSLKDAAKLAGVSVAAPYRHFADKEALLSAIQFEGFARFNGELAAAYERDGTSQEKLEELGVAYLRFAMGNPAYFQVMFGGAAGKHSEPEDIAGHSTGDGFLLLMKAVGEAYPEQTRQEQMDRVLLAWSTVHGFAMLQMEGSLAGTIGTGDPEARLRGALRLMIYGPAWVLDDQGRRVG